MKLCPFVRTLVAVASLAAVVGCKGLGGGGGPKPTADECDALFSHEADLLAGKTASAAAKQSAKVSLIQSDTTSQWCEAMSRKTYDCSMKAPTKAAFDACD